MMKKTGLPAGLGAHSIETPKACAKAGIVPDFFMKTFHSDDYFSATPREKRREFLVDSNSPDNHDNIWDIKSEATREFMATVHTPWVAFKVMAAGAIPPEKAFNFAYRGGADFICAESSTFSSRKMWLSPRRFWLRTWTEAAPGWHRASRRRGGPPGRPRAPQGAPPIPPHEVRIL